MVGVPEKKRNCNKASRLDTEPINHQFIIKQMEVFLNPDAWSTINIDIPRVLE
jgi:hypothetical protein